MIWVWCIPLYRRLSFSFLNRKTIVTHFMPILTKTYHMKIFQVVIWKKWLTTNARKNSLILKIKIPETPVIEFNLSNIICVLTKNEYKIHIAAVIWSDFNWERETIAHCFVYFIGVNMCFWWWCGPDEDIRIIETDQVSLTLNSKKKIRTIWCTDKMNFDKNVINY